VIRQARGEAHTTGRLTVGGSANPAGHGLGPGLGSVHGVGAGAVGLSNMGSHAAQQVSNSRTATRIGSTSAPLPAYHNGIFRYGIVSRRWPISL
jgi:hypothetical protein